MPPRRGSVVMLTQDRHVDRRILLQADTLEAAGWSVRVLALPADGEAAGPDDARVVRIADSSDALQGWHGTVLSVYRSIRRRLPMGGRVMRLLKDLTWRFAADPETFFLRLFEASVRRHPADVYVAHDLPMLPVGVAAKRLHGARLVYDSHELYAEQAFPDSQRRTWQALERKYVGQCDAVTTVNASIAAELSRRYGLQDVVVVQNAERPFEPSGRERRFHAVHGLPAEAQVLLYQGGLSAGRHLETLVRAMRKVHDPAVHLVLLGSGALRTSLERLARADKALARRVHLQQAVAQSDLLAWTACADAGIIPYQPDCLNAYFCTPNKLFEFIAAGVPILGSDLPEIRRIVVGNGIGEVADLSSEDRLAAAIDSFFADASRLARWRDSTVAAQRTIHWDAEGAKLVRIVEGLL